MTQQHERDARVADAVEAWLSDPLSSSSYRELLSAVRSRRAASGPRPPVASVAVSVGEPKQHRDPVFLQAKLARLHEPHVAPLQALVDAVRDQRGTTTVPYADPAGGGVGARVLFVLESPAGPAAMGSGMLSPDNDDETAANMWRLYRDSGLARSRALHWNAVPWYVGEGGRERSVTAQDVLEGAVWLARVADLLPDLRLVVTMGKPAAKAYQAHLDAGGRALGEWLASPHPGPRVRNGHARLWPQVEAAFARAAEVAQD